MSAHGVATALNREYLGFSLFLFLNINLCLPVQEKHKI